MPPDKISYIRIELKDASHLNLLIRRHRNRPTAYVKMTKAMSFLIKEFSKYLWAKTVVVDL